jgi:hypothetical protein
MDDFDAELQQEIQAYQKTTQQKMAETKQNQSFLEKITSPNDPQPFSWTNVGVSTAIGAGLAVPTGVGVPLGAAGGFLSGIAGETARSVGASDLNTFGAEMFGGTVPALTKTVAKPLVKIVSYRAGRATDLIPDNAEQIALRKAKEKIYGKDTIDVIHTTENLDAVQQTLRNELFPNVLIPENKPVSTYLRESMYDKIKTLRTSQPDIVVESPIREASRGFSKQADTTTASGSTDIIPSSRGSEVVTTNRGTDVVTRKETTSVGQRNNTGVSNYQSQGSSEAFDTINVKGRPVLFSQSQEFKDLMTKDLKALYARDRISPKELASLHKIVRTDSSSMPDVVNTSTEDIINLIQNGGTFVREGVEQKKIPEEAQKLLRNRFNEFLERNLGTKEYNKLKEVEKLEFIAKARDTIPTLLDSKFRLGSDEYSRVLGFIKDSPEGKVDFNKALLQHLSSLKDEVQMKREFIRLRPAIAEAKVLSKEELAGLSAKINSFDKTVKAEKRLELLKQVIVTPLIGAASAETSSKLTPFKIFTL